MPNPMLTARFDPDVADRVQACADAHNRIAVPGAPRVDRGDVVRMLIMRALPDMEAELGVTPAMRRKAAAKRSAKKTKTTKAKRSTKTTAKRSTKTTAKPKKTSGQRRARR